MHNRKAREKARVFVIQALYQHHFNPEDAAAIEAEFRARNDYHKYVDWDFFHEVLTAAFDNRPEIKTVIEECAARPLKEINPTELAVIYAAASELKTRLDVPYQVVLAEYVDLSHQFGATDAYQFVNAVLEKLSYKYRAIERSAL